MIRTRVLTLSLLVAAPFAATACGGNDDPADQVKGAIQSALDDAKAEGAATPAQADGASKAVAEAMKQAQEQAAKAAGQAAQAADADDAPSGAADMAGMAGFMQRFLKATTPLRQEAQAIQQRMSSGEIDAEEGQKQIAEVSQRMQKAIADVVADLQRDGKLPEEMKQQIDAMTKQLQPQGQGN